MIAHSHCSMDQRILELIDSGHRIEAIKLTRKRYACSLTQTRAFVESLSGPSAQSPKEPAA